MKELTLKQLAQWCGHECVIPSPDEVYAKIMEAAKEGGAE